MPKRDFLAIPDFSRPELIDLFDLAAAMKRGDYAKKPLSGKAVVKDPAILWRASSVIRKVEPY